MNDILSSVTLLGGLLAKVSEEMNQSPRTLEQLKQAISRKVSDYDFSWDSITKMPSITEKMVAIIGGTPDALRDLATSLIVHDIKIDQIVSVATVNESKFDQLRAHVIGLNRNLFYLQSKYNEHLEQGHGSVRRTLGPKRNRQRYRAWARRR